MSRIQTAFKKLKEKGETAFIPFVTVGDPNLEWTEKIVYDLQAKGADLIELGIPYSDPLADGPVIQAAALRSLQQGTRIVDAFELVKRLRAKGVTIPLILFTYVNPVMQWGIEKFFQTAKEVGADGAIIPDLPLEESEEAHTMAAKYEVDLIPLVAPTSRNRIQQIVKSAMGFIYCVSSLGVTGMRNKLSSHLPEFVESVRSATSLPVAVGFGVSTSEQADLIGKFADGVIIGSAIIRRIQPIYESLEKGDRSAAETYYKELLQFAGELKEPLRA